MKGKKLQMGLARLLDTIMRYPLTIAFLIFITIVNSFMIENNISDNLYSKLIFTFAIGTLFSLVAQALYERFFENKMHHLLLMGSAIVLTAVYYLIIFQLSELNQEATLRSFVGLFALLIAFLWIPAIKSKVTFNQSFLAVFRAFFLALVYFVILFLGVSLIFMAIDRLIKPLDGDTYSHAANLIFCLGATTYLISLLPFYSKEVENKEEEENIIKNKSVITTTKFLETLVSYVIIPVTAVFTLVLLFYIIMNITGSFWSDNLMEPLLVSYSITVIIVYLLASNISNAFANIFRRIFPKVLVPIVLFQTIASTLKIQDMGITQGRYYAILFGIFATIAGFLFCFLPIRKNGIIAPILIILALISIIPPIDALTISRKNQIGRLKNTLIKNNMLENDTITPNNAISEEDQMIIINSMQYLDSMGYSEDIDWLSAYAESNNFEATFGFPRYISPGKYLRNIFLRREPEAIPITGYDVLLRASFYYNLEEIELGSFSKDEVTYRLVDKAMSAQERYLVLLDQDNTELLRFDLQQIYDRAIDKGEDYRIITLEEAVFTEENDKAKITVIADHISVDKNMDNTIENQQADVNILIDIKN